MGLIKDYPKDQVKFIMEATGIYHLGLLNELQKQGYFVHVANPLLIKKYFDAEIRKGKTDRKDALKLSRYGTEKCGLKDTQKLIKFIWISISITRCLNLIKSNLPYQIIPV